MCVVAVVAVVFLSAFTPSYAQQLAADSAKPLNVRFVEASFEEAISVVARLSGVAIELDRSVTAELRRQSLAAAPLVLREAGVEQAVGALVARNGLSYAVVDSKTIRIYKKE